MRDHQPYVVLSWGENGPVPGTRLRFKRLSKALRARQTLVETDGGRYGVHYEKVFKEESPRLLYSPDQ